MENFEKRRDRFNFFENFEDPLLNLTFRLETENFLTVCKERGEPPFHFFLYCLLKAFDGIENFKYRNLNGEVFKIDEIFGSYTVINQEGLFNYTRFENSNDRKTFIQNSLKAKAEAEAGNALINTGVELPIEEMKKYIFITSIPWLDFTSIKHPVFKYKSADIPAVAWGRWDVQGTKITMPFSLQAHHGFVDGYHMHAYAELLKQTIQREIEA